MDLHISRFRVTKRVPLTISRGTEAASENVWVRLQHDGFEGWGEAAPMSSAQPPQYADNIIAALEEIAPVISELTPFQGQRLEASPFRSPRRRGRPSTWPATTGWASASACRCGKCGDWICLVSP